MTQVLHKAVGHKQGGHTQVVKLLVKHGADLNAWAKHDEYGKASLANLAAIYDHGPILAYLRRQGIDVESRLPDGYTSVHFAAQDGSVEALRFLVKSRADLNAKDSGGMSPIHLAVFFGNGLCTKLLLQSRADPSTRDPQGLLPVEQAAKRGHKDIAKLLRKHEARAANTRSEL